ncbi:MAG: DUF4177 domain-containing protein [Pseudomonadota bacterium]
MTRYEYKVVPAPTSGLKTKGVKSSEARFANALETLMNTLGNDGWIYVRADTLPCEERSGLTGRVTKYQNMLVFQRPLENVATPQVAGLLAAPEPDAVPIASAEPEPEYASVTPSSTAPALGAAEPRLTRAEASETSAAARAAAAALRPFRAQSQAQSGGVPQDAGQAPALGPAGAPRGSGVAAE